MKLVTVCVVCGFIHSTHSSPLGLTISLYLLGLTALLWKNWLTEVPINTSRLMLATRFSLQASLSPCQLQVWLTYTAPYPKLLQVRDWAGLSLPAASLIFIHAIHFGYMSFWPSAPCPLGHCSWFPSLHLFTRLGPVCWSYLRLLGFSLLPIIKTSTP